MTLRSVERLKLASFAATPWLRRVAVVFGFAAWASMGSAPGAIAATPGEADNGSTRPKIGLALSGGGARGAAHVGVLKILEEYRVPVDYIAGTSMGAVVGGLYASGLTADELAQQLAELPWDKLFADKTRRRDLAFRRKQDDRNFLSTFHLGFKDWKPVIPAGFIQGQKLEQELSVLSLPVADVRDFDDFMIPFRAVATNIATGEAVVLGGGDLAMAIRASMSIPGAMAPVEIDGHLLVDGGTAMNLPVDVVREMGADIIIAVDIGTPLRDQDELGSALSITGQTVTIQIQQNTVHQIAKLGPEDILIVPDLGDVTTASFDKVEEAVTSGVVAAIDARDSIQRLSVSEPEWEAYQRSQVRPSREMPMITSIRIENDSGLSESVLRDRLSIKTGEPLDLVTLRRDIDVLFGLDIFDEVDFSLDPGDGGKVLVLHVKERYTGRTRMRFGLELETDFANESLFNLGVSVTHIPMNGLGAELRTEFGIGENPKVEAEWWQPVEPSGRYFIAPKISFDAGNLDLFSGDDAIVRYRLWNFEAGIAAGREFGQFGELRVGLRYNEIHASRRIGDPFFPSGERKGGELFVNGALDTLDDSRFPTKGTFVVFESEFGFTGLGSAGDYQLLKIQGTQAFSFGDDRRNTILLESEYATTFGDDRQIGALFPLGGFLRLSGLRPNQLLGSELILFRIRAYRRIAAPGILSFKLPLYVGGSVEGGNTAFTDKLDLGDLLWGGSVYVAMDTPLSPIYLAYGNTHGRNNAVYFFMGQVF